MQCWGKRPVLALVSALLLSVLPVSRISESPAFHHEPQSAVTKSALGISKVAKPETASKALLKIHDQRDFAKVTVATDVEESSYPLRWFDDLLLGNPEFIAFGQVTADSTEVKLNEDFDPTVNNGAVSGDGPTDGMRLNLTSWLSVAVEVVLPLGQRGAEELNRDGLDNEFRVFGSLAMRF